MSHFKDYLQQSIGKFLPDLSRGGEDTNGSTTGFFSDEDEDDVFQDSDWHAAEEVKSMTAEEQALMVMEARAAALRNKNFADLGQLINKLQDLSTICHQDLKISLPQIVVVGSQSVGKSSVLENLAGREFLPRGGGMVTRCPLVLQMNRIPNGEKAWMEFFPSNDVKYFHDQDVRDEIDRRTNESTNGKNSISRTPINLKLFSPDVVDLTLVDLPGLVRNAAADQPVDLPQSINSLVMEYIEDPNSIILAVSAADFDLANSESLEIARKVDPHGNRTFGVLTKLDLVRCQCIGDTLKILDNILIPIQWGYVGVVNPETKRGEESKISVTETRAREEAILKGKFPTIADKHGTAVLQRKLAQELTRHIKEKAPEVKAELERKKKEITNKLKSYGIDDMACAKNLFDPQNQRKELWKYVKQFSDSLSTMEGFSLADAKDSTAAFGANITATLREIIQDVQSVGRPSLEETKIVMKRVLGIQLPFSTPQLAFNKMLKTAMEERFKSPVIEGVEKILHILESCIQEELTEMAVYPMLQLQVQELMLKKLEGHGKECKTYLEKFLAVEASFPNFNHPVFLQKEQRQKILELEKKAEEEKSSVTDQTSGTSSTSSARNDEVIELPDTVLSRMSAALATLKVEEAEGSHRVDWEEKFDEVAKECCKKVTVYLDVVEMNIADQVPKAIVLFIIHQTIKYATDELLQEQDFMGEIGALMEVSEDRRIEIQALGRQLEAVVKGLEEVRKFRL